MAIDRMNEIRQNNYRGNNSYQQQPAMSSPYGHSAYNAGYANSSVSNAMDPTFEQVEKIKSNIQQISQCTEQLKSFHRRALVEISSRESAALSQQIDQLTDHISTLIQTTRAQIKGLAKIKTLDKTTSQQQQKALARNLMNVAKEYQTLQQSAKKGYKDNLKRQYKIAKPYATEQEIERVLDSGQAGSVFQQEIMSSRVSDQRRMLEQVQGRQHDLEKIEQSLVELMNLMQDMQMIVESQQVMIDNIETNVESAAVAVEDGSNQLTKATNSARSARKKKWILFFIVLILLAVIAVVVYIQLVPKPGTTTNNNNGSTPTTTNASSNVNSSK